MFIFHAFYPAGAAVAANALFFRFLLFRSGLFGRFLFRIRAVVFFLLFGGCFLTLLFFFFRVFFFCRFLFRSRCFFGTRFLYGLFFSGGFHSIGFGGGFFRCFLFGGYRTGNIIFFLRFFGLVVFFEIEQVV